MTDEDLLHAARERMQEADDAERLHIERGESDIRFATGDQWDEADRQEREAARKPVITINAMPQFIRQVTGQIRSINPAIRVVPGDATSSKDTAEVYEGLIRQIENESDAASVYEAAAESAAACSIGYWRVLTDYVDGATFDQEIRIARIYNPFSVRIDPFAKHPTRCDARYAFIIEHMAKDEFEQKYPGKRVVSTTVDAKLDGITYWMRGEDVVVAEYFWIDHREYEIAQSADGAIWREPLPKGVEFARKRKVREPYVMWAKVSGVEVLEEPREFPCRYIPIVAVTGEEWHLGEETYRSSVIRFAKDPQRLMNFARSVEAEITATQPKAPWLLTGRHIEGFEKYWADAHMTTRAYLPFNVDEDATGLIPQRVQPPVASQALQAQIALAGEDLKRTTGIYDASLGARSNETSGRAIEARKVESQTATSVYADNMIKGIVQTGKIICAMIPKVYDTARTIRILGEDSQEKQVQINQVFQSQDGQQYANDMTRGKYGVRINVGPTFASKRQEAAESMLEFQRTNPQAAPLIGDLVAKSMDWPESERVAERLRAVLPPGVIKPDEMEPEQQQQARQAAAQAAQMQQVQSDIAIRLQAAEVEEAQAKAAKAKADAVKAEVEAREAQMRLAALGGEAERAIEAEIQARIGRAFGAASAA